MAGLSEFSELELGPHRAARPDGELVDELLASSPFGYIYATDEPFYAAGAEPFEDGVWWLWGFGTPGVNQSKWLTRHLRRDIILPLFGRGATRLHSRGLGGYSHVVRWMETLGASVRYERGPEGEDTALYTWERQ